jgi:hypothetical protein
MLDAGCKKAHGSRRTAQGGWLLDTGPNELIDNAVFFNPKSAIRNLPNRKAGLKVGSGFTAHGSSV